MSRSLSERLKTETRALHTAAERSAFMGVLLSGRIARPAYCALLRNLHAIYAVLEPALARHSAHPLIAPVFAQPLRRQMALEHDLAVQHGPRWADELTLRPVTLAYAARLRDIGSSQPGLLLAHAYIRYLGDLSGGQLLRRIVAGSAALAGTGGVAFYDFGDAAATQRLTRAFRAGLLGIAVDAAQSDALVDEARFAFRLHQRLFDELALDCGIGAGVTGVVASH